MLNSLDKKKMTTSDYESENKVIMTEPTMLFPDFVRVDKTFVVDEYYAGRIDLISLNLYNNANYSDQILKFNGISNPFSIGVGDVLDVPPLDVLLKQWKKPGIGIKEANVVRDKFIDTKRLPIKDQNRLDYLKRKAAEKPNGAKEILPPNVLKSDQTNVVIQNGETIVGAAMPTTKDRTSALLTSNKAFEGEIQKLNKINNNTNNKL
jgi:hypothetical protein